MSLFASRARQLKEALVALSLRARELRGLALVDPDGLVMVSTFNSRSVEETLAATVSSIAGQFHRAQSDFAMGPLHSFQLAGRDRQLFWVPVSREASLVALADSGLAAQSLEILLLATARDLLELATTPDASTP